MEQACLDGAGDADMEDLLRKVSAELDTVLEELQARETVLSS